MIEDEKRNAEQYKDQVSDWLLCQGVAIVNSWVTFFNNWPKEFTCIFVCDDKSKFRRSTMV